MKYLIAIGLFFISTLAISAEKSPTVLNCKVAHVQGNSDFTYDRKGITLAVGDVIDMPVTRLTEEGDTYTYQTVFLGGYNAGNPLGKMTISRADGTFRYEITIGGMLAGSVTTGTCADPAKVKAEESEWRKHVVLGSDTHCGMIVDMRLPLVKVQTTIGEKWFKLGELEPPGSTSCNFANGVYQGVEKPMRVVDIQPYVAEAPKINYQSWIGKTFVTDNYDNWVFSSPSFLSHTSSLSRNVHVTVYEIHFPESGTAPDYVRISPDGAQPIPLHTS